jgi:hypothetical protein
MRGNTPGVNGLRQREILRTWRKCLQQRLHFQ